MEVGRRKERLRPDLHRHHLLTVEGLIRLASRLALRLVHEHLEGVLEVTVRQPRREPAGLLGCGALHALRRPFIRTARVLAAR